MKKALLVTALVVLAVVFSGKYVFAGPPFVNLEGVGGVAFNPLAYVADGDASLYRVSDIDVVGKPRFGAWYVNLDHVGVDWTSFGVADTFFKKLEVSYGHQAVAQSNNLTHHKNNVGLKYQLLPENSFDKQWVPAVSVGSIFKTTNKPGAGVHDSGFDYYLVGTKLITQLPRPVLLSAGILSSGERVTGVFGFSNKRKQTAFANIDLVLPHDVIVGYEYKQGSETAAFKNDSYWDAHVAWSPNKNLTFIGAYVSAGNNKSTRVTGLGDGFVLSGQYAF